jgi:hypothetical protein
MKTVCWIAVRSLPEHAEKAETATRKTDRTMAGLGLAVPSSGIKQLSSLGLLHSRRDSAPSHHSPALSGQRFDGCLSFGSTYARRSIRVARTTIQPTKTLGANLTLARTDRVGPQVRTSGEKGPQAKRRRSCAFRHQFSVLCLLVLARPHEISNLKMTMELILLREPETLKFSPTTAR